MAEGVVEAGGELGGGGGDGDISAGGVEGEVVFFEGVGVDGEDGAAGGEGVEEGEVGGGDDVVMGFEVGSNVGFEAGDAADFFGLG